MKWKPSYFTREQMEERRREGGRLLREGKLSKAEIARQLGVSRASVTAWSKVVEKKGIRGLISKKARGRTSKLNTEQKNKLKKLLRRGASKSGYLTDRWTLERVAELIKKEFGISYHPKGLGRVLDKLGFSLQKPLARADERDEELVKAWLLQDWSRIKKAWRLGAVIVFLDEFGFSFLEPISTTWAPKGQRPVFRRVTKDRRVLTTLAALALTGKVYKLHFSGSMSSEQVIQFLKHLQRHVPGNIILIWDRARIHTGTATQKYIREHREIHQEYLPAYAPELNPEEYCHGNVKRYLKNARPEDKRQMQTLLNLGFARFRRKPALLLKFFHAAGLSVRQFQLP